MSFAMQGIIKTSFFQNENQFEISENNSDTDRDPSDAFIITIKTDNTGTSNDDQFTLPWIGTYDVDWGDGNTETSVVDTQTHTYASAGTYDVAVTATTGRISFNNSNDALKLLDIKNWGTCAWTSMDAAFRGCTSLTSITATDAPNLSNATNVTLMFWKCRLSNADFSNWNVSNITTTDRMFSAGGANGTINLSNWDVSNVTNMYAMFYDCTNLVPIGVEDWDTQSLLNAQQMFRNTQLFNQSLANWDINQVTNFTNFMNLTSGLSTSNYDATLIAWAAQNPQCNVNINFGDSKYSCDAEAARDELINTYEWTIIDGGNESPNIITYDGNNTTSGDTPIDNIEYRCTDTAAVLGNIGNLSRPCYLFNGWNTAADSSGTTYVPGDTFAISEPTTLYAQWVFDIDCESVMITQYYEGDDQNKWIEIKNISGAIIPANSLYIVSLQGVDADNPTNADPTSGGASFNSFTLISEELTIDEVRRFRDPGANLPTYASPEEIDYDNNPTYNLHANPYSGDDIILISNTNDSTTWSNLIDVIGNGTNWGSNKVFIRKDTIEGPSRSFDIDEWVEFSILDMNNVLTETNTYLGKHFNEVTDFNGVGVYDGWTKGFPDKSRTATIIANYDTDLKDSFGVYSLTTASDRSINIRSGDYITIVNDLTVNARGVLNIEHQGSLVMVNDSGTVTNDGSTNVSRKTSNMEQYDYHYWSSPIDYSTNTTPVASVLTDFFASRIYEFNTSAFADLDDDNFDDDQNDWVNYSSEMKSGTGYAAMTSNPGERNTVFSGKVNNGIITVYVQLSGDENSDADGDEDDWNLLGNPYPSAISADEFITQNSDINGTLYFWTHVDDISIDNPGPDGYNFSTDDYAMYSLTGGIASASNSAQPTGIIETGLGFFVDAISAGTVEFNNSMRSKSYANNNSFSASSSNEIIEKDRFWLNLTNPNGAFSQILIGFFEDATLEKDRLYDGVRLKGNNYIDFYSLDNTSYEYGIQGRPNFDENESIVLGYQSNILGSLSIDLGTREGVLSETPIYITDHYLSITHDLTIAPYSFNTEVGTFNDRFEIAFNQTSLSTNDIQIDPKTLQIIELQNGQVQVKVPSQFEMTTIQVMDISGKVIYNFSTQGSSQIFSLNNLSKTAYLVTVALNNGQTITKKTVKRK